MQKNGEYLVEKLVDHRYNHKTQKYEYLVQWLGYSEAQNQWLPLENLNGSIDLVKKYNEEEFSLAKHYQVHNRAWQHEYGATPNGILRNDQALCTLSWPKYLGIKPETTKMRTVKVKDCYPQLLLERILYDKHKIIPKYNDFEISGSCSHNVQSCVMDLKDDWALVKWANDEELNLRPNTSWVNKQYVDAELMLEYLETLSITKFAQ